MTGGTEAFPDLGSHCQHPDCNLLDFLPFTCNACSKILCLDHRSYKSHDCPNSDVGSRRVFVCETCSAAIETTGCDDVEVKNLLKRHERSGDCDPTKKKKPTCAVRRCKEVLTFSNTAACKSCGIKTCLKHRFPADHACERLRSPPSSTDSNIKLLKALAIRNGKDCANKKITSPNPTPTLKAY